MSVSTLFQSALLKFGQTPDNQRFADDFYNALNNAQYDFATSHSWGFLRTSATLTATASTRAIALPSNFGKPYGKRGALRITTAAYAGDEIQLMSYDEWLGSEYFEDGTTTGEPTAAYIEGSNLCLSPIPDAAYTIVLIYHKVPATISDSSDAITIPELYQECLRKMIYRRLQDDGYSSIQELQISDNDIARLINNAARDDARKYGGATFNLERGAFTRRTV